MCLSACSLFNQLSDVEVNEKVRELLQCKWEKTSKIGAEKFLKNLEKHLNIIYYNIIYLNI